MLEIQEYDRSRLLAGYLPERHICDTLKISDATLRRWRRIGEGPPYIKVPGRSVLYPVAEFEKWLQARIVHGVRSKRVA